MNKGIVLFLIMGWFAAIAMADTSATDQYQVNVLVVEKITAQALQSEVWLPIKKFPRVEDAVDPQTLPIESCRLGAKAQRFNRMGYRVLVNTCWQQSIPVTKFAQPIHVFGGAAVEGLNQVDGTITFNREKSFEVQANILLTEKDGYLESKGNPNYAVEIADRDPKRFQLRKDFVMRSNELTYVDHPLFGVVITITPL
jgi:hypothetical protein